MIWANPFNNVGGGTGYLKIRGWVSGCGGGGGSLIKYNLGVYL